MIINFKDRSGLQALYNWGLRQNVISLLNIIRLLLFILNNYDFIILLMGSLIVIPWNAFQWMYDVHYLHNLIYVMHNYYYVFMW